jgi:hypothetical protein
MVIWRIKSTNKNSIYHWHSEWHDNEGAQVAHWKRAQTSHTHISRARALSPKLGKRRVTAAEKRRRRRQWWQRRRRRESLMRGDNRSDHLLCQGKLAIQWEVSEWAARTPNKAMETWAPHRPEAWSLLVLLRACVLKRLSAFSAQIAALVDGKCSVQLVVIAPKLCTLDYENFWTETCTLRWVFSWGFFVRCVF